jgi:hypothetical protein
MNDRLAIGSNNPPAFDTYSIALDDLRIEAGNYLDGAALETQGQADAVGQLISTAKKIRKDADAQRAEEKRPHDEAAKAVQTKWKPLLDKADTIIAAAQKPLSAYLSRLADEQREAERLARIEADRLAQEARAARMASEGDIEAIERAKVLEAEAETAAKDAKRAGKAKAHVAGVDRAIGLRSYWSHQLIARRELLDWVMRNDPDGLTDMLNEYARKAVANGTRHLPGVSITQQQRAA